MKRLDEDKGVIYGLNFVGKLRTFYQNQKICKIS